MNHHRTTGALRECDLKGRSIRTTRGKQCVRKQVRSIEREGVDAQKIDKLGYVVRAKWPVCNFFAAGSDDYRVKFVVLPHAIDDQASPVDGHGIGGHATDNPKGWLVGKVPPNNCTLVRVVATELGGKIGFQA